MEDKWELCESSSFQSDAGSTPVSPWNEQKARAWINFNSEEEMSFEAGTPISRYGGLSPEYYLERESEDISEVTFPVEMASVSPSVDDNGIPSDPCIEPERNEDSEEPKRLWNAKVVSYAVGKSSDGTDVVLYEIRVEHLQKGQWTVRKRYTQFLELYTTLKHRHNFESINKFRFPPKDFFQVRQSEQPLQERQQAFDVFCQIMTKLKPLPQAVEYFLKNRPSSIKTDTGGLEVDQELSGLIDGFVTEDSEMKEKSLYVHFSEKHGVKLLWKPVQNVSEVLLRYYLEGHTPNNLKEPFQAVSHVRITEIFFRQGFESCYADVPAPIPQPAPIPKAPVKESSANILLRAILRIQSIFRGKIERLRLLKRQKAHKTSINYDILCKQLLVANRSELYHIFKSYMDKLEPAIKRKNAGLFAVNFRLVPEVVTRTRLNELISELVQILNEDPDSKEVKIESVEAPLHYIAFLRLLILLARETEKATKGQTLSLGTRLSDLFRKMDASGGKQKMGGSLSRNSYSSGDMIYANSAKLPSPAKALAFDLQKWLLDTHFKGSENAANCVQAKTASGAAIKVNISSNSVEESSPLLSRRLSSRSCLTGPTSPRSSTTPNSAFDVDSPVGPTSPRSLNTPKSATLQKAKPAIGPESAGFKDRRLSSRSGPTSPRSSTTPNSTFDVDSPVGPTSPRSANALKSAKLQKSKSAFGAESAGLKDSPGDPTSPRSSSTPKSPRSPFGVNSHKDSEVKKSAPQTSQRKSSSKKPASRSSSLKTSPSRTSSIGKSITTPSNSKGK